MTDFHSVLQRAVSSLPDPSGSNRRAVYDKARKALVKQLQSFDPPLPSSEVTAQRLALEDAIRRLESEIARSARTRRAVQSAMPPAPAAGTARPQPPGAARAPEPPAAPPAQPATPAKPEAAHPRHGATAAEPAAQREEADVPDAAQHERADAADTREHLPADAASPDEPVTAEPDAPGEDTGAAAAPAAPARPDREHARAERTEHATLQAERRARRERERAERQQQRREWQGGRAAPSPTDPEAVTAADRGAPLGEAGREAPDTDAAYAEIEAIAAEAASDETGRGAQEAGEAGTGRAPPHVAAKRLDRASAQRSLAARVLMPLVVLVVLAGVGAAAYTQRDQILALIEPGEAGGEPDGAAAPASDSSAVSTKVTDRLGAPPDPENDPDTRRVRTTRILAGPDGPRAAAPSDDAEPDAPAVAGTAAPTRDVTPGAPDAGGQADAPAEILRDPSATNGAADPGTNEEPGEAAFETAALGETAEDAADPAAPQAGERPPTEAEIETSAVRAATPDAPDGESAALGANAGSGPQIAVLYEEGAEPGARGAALSGNVVWEVAETSVGGQDPEWVVRASATVPDRDLTVNLTIRENHDDTLPASHLIELSFITPDDFPGGSVANVPGLIMKETEEERGNALLGAAAQVSSGLFWIALSSGDDDRVQNMRLLTDRAWIDIPILYENGRRAILTLQKGEDGGRAVVQAFEAWEKG